jgi:predicted dehydrogenase
LRFRCDLRQYSARRFRHANEKGAGLYLACCKTYSARRNISADDKVNIAFVGVGLQGRQNLKALAHQNVVAICDVHAGYGHVAKSLAKHPDAVVVCTPDYSHAFISLTPAGG